MVTSHVIFGKLYAWNMQMQDNYGDFGYFLETGGTNKRKHVESLKLTEVFVSDKLESFRASEKVPYLLLLLLIHMGFAS
ncbi:hypothetical protein GIB67_042802 [Kingdonia uniflora]|uniref:Uncharacterized protein n=1 Tax=Kingdonia uniflora TaxID=39325 RepID=A0A7J7L166_9MAGN|nr:hypothetical protein GIB67_042802 [Kingdonia uniflora]